MKKICCVLMACMMIFTGLSMPVFAAGEGFQSQSNQIHNLKIVKNDLLKSMIKRVSLNEVQISRLAVKVNDVFECVVEGVDFSECEGALLDAVCCCGMLADYYKVKQNDGKCNEYKAKADIISAMIIEILLKGRHNDLDILKAKLFYLAFACDCAEKSRNLNFHCDFFKFMDSIYRQMLSMDICKDCKNYKEILDKLKTELPTHKEIVDLAYNTEDFSEKCQLFFNASKLFSYYKEVFCLFKADEKVYRIESVIQDILYGYYKLADKKTDMGLSFLIND